ncbi:MAG: universal stress protein [Nocardioides sp.]|nr:universal stress protein [Nocardioides sp.]
MSSSEVLAGSIVVGVDGSDPADQALDWAVEQAGLERRPLTLLHAAHLGGSGDAGLAGLPGLDVGAVLEDLRVCGHELLENATRRVALLDPDVVVHPVLSTDDPRVALLHLAERASTVVIGSRGRGTVASLLLGSVSVSVSKHAACPVVVVRTARGALPGKGVLVGLDGTPENTPAIEFAYRTASFRSLPLTAVHVFWDSAHLGADEHEVADDEAGLDDLRALMSESVAGMREKFPDVVDRLSLVRGFRDRQLIRASRAMDLVVVGSRQRGFINDFVYGSVSPTVVEHAGCDVAVVPAQQDARH